MYTLKHTETLRHINYGTLYFCYLFSGSILLTYIVVQKTFIGVVFTVGIMFGLSMGIGYSVAIACAVSVSMNVLMGPKY